jgi:DNA-binding HxlR family transcriptional regulator
MLNRDYEGQDFCGVARSLEIIGERWTLLIIRDAFFGLRRFEEFQSSLGIARNVLTDRLNRLVEEGVFDRVRYSERPERFEYRLTAKGRDLNVALTALREWGDRHLLEQAPSVLRRRSDGKAVVAALVPEGTKTLKPRELELVPRPWFEARSLAKHGR